MKKKLTKWRKSSSNIVVRGHFCRWSSGQESALQFRGHRLDPWSENYDPTHHRAAKPVYATTEPLRHKTRDSPQPQGKIPQGAAKTRSSQTLKNIVTEKVFTTLKNQIVG